jgi:hypothetical protein
MAGIYREHASRCAPVGSTIDHPTANPHDLPPRPPPADGHLLEFPLIRVDCFTQTTPIFLPPSYLPAPNAQLYLLSHIHTDHLEGLSTASEFNGTILCSAASKEMLLRLEAATQRVLHLKGHIETPRRKYWNALQPRARLRTVDEIRKGKAKGSSVKVDPFVSRPVRACVVTLR